LPCRTPEKRAGPTTADRPTLVPGGFRPAPLDGVDPMFRKIVLELPSRHVHKMASRESDVVGYFMDNERWKSQCIGFRGGIELRFCQH